MAKAKSKKKKLSEGEKRYFSNDLIERFIKIEQNVSKSFGEDIPYEKTEYYKSLSDKEKKMFKEYLKKKKKKKKWKIFALSIPVIAILFSVAIFGIDFTGNVVSDAATTSTGSLGFGGALVLGIIGAAIVIAVATSFSKKITDRRIQKRVSVR